MQISRFEISCSSDSNCCRVAHFPDTTITRVPSYIDVIITVDDIPTRTALFIDLVKIELLTVVGRRRRSDENLGLRDDMGVEILLP